MRGKSDLGKAIFTLQKLEVKICTLDREKGRRKILPNMRSVEKVDRKKGGAYRVFTLLRW